MDRTMNARGMSVADWIGQVRKTLAFGAAQRQREVQPQLVAAYGTAGLTDLVTDNEVRLDYLAQALSCGRPELFEQHTEWLKVAFTGRGAEPGFVRVGLTALRDELAATLPEDARAMAADFVERGLRAFDRCSGETPPFLVDGAPLVELARRYLLAILEGRRPDAVGLVMDAVEAGADPDDLLQHVVTRVQQELGRMWQIGEVHAAEEHFASRVAERLTTMLHAKVAAAPRSGRKVLVASVGGNDHDLGARFVADRFERAGWDAILLGANSPAADVARSVLDYEPDLVALSTALALHIRSTATVVAAIRQIAPELRVPIVVGGGPFQTVPKLWQDVGADGTAMDARGAVELAERLVGAD
jgi:methylmalonyl-CoA mutase cobalamin-binding domain/chain